MKKIVIYILLIPIIFLSGCSLKATNNRSTPPLSSTKSNVDNQSKDEVNRLNDKVDVSKNEQASLQSAGQPALTQNISNDIKIEAPLDGTEFNVGDSLNIKIHIDNFEKLETFMISFGGDTIFEKPSSPDSEYRFIINGEYIENQYIVVAGNFRDGARGFRSTDNKVIKVNPVGEIMDFNIRPELIMMEKGKIERPDYEAIFPTAIASIGATNLFKVSIKDPSLLSYDEKTNSFTALNYGITAVNISYRGIMKYVFFEIPELKTPPTD